MRANTLEIMHARQEAKRQAYRDMWNWCVAHSWLAFRAIANWFRS